MKNTLRICAVFAAALIFFTSCSLQAEYSNADISEGVSIEKEFGRYVLSPENSEPDELFIFYPGGLVEEEAYLPVLSMIADAGIRVVLVRMPLDLAVFDQNEALNVMEDYPGYDYFIGGHSLGGAMACGVCSRNPGVFSGLSLWASYTTENWNLSGSDLRVQSLRGSLDGVAPLADIEAADGLLPADTEIFIIEGGNHSGFGSYGPQKDDFEAEITKTEQHIIISDSVLSFIFS